jgi:hypothetical protein
MALNSNFRTLTADNIEGIVDDRNYLKSSFENGTITGWREMAVTIDASGFPNATPTIGTDASPNAASSLSLSATSTTPLSGSRSLLVTVPTSLSQGHGFISEEFTLDRMDLGKVLTVSFDYERISGTYNFSGTRGSQTWMVYIYDATLGAANWIQPAGFLGMNQSSNPGRVACTFQTSVTAGQKYRVAVIASQAAAGASSIEFDNFTCSRQTAPIGPVVTDWVSYTPAWTTNGTQPSIGNGTLTGRWRRVGDSIEGDIGLVAGSTTNFGSGQWAFGLPSGITLDSSKIAQIAGEGPLGYGSIIDSGTANYGPFTVAGSGSNAFFLRAANASGTWVTSSSAASQGNPATLGGGDAINLHFFAPIQGWSSSVQMSNDTDTRVVAFGSYFSGSLSVANNNTNVPITGYTQSFDTHGTWSQSNGTYVIPVSGFWKVNAFHVFNAGLGTISAAFVTRMYVNNVLTADMTRSDVIPAAYNGAANTAAASKMFRLNAGDVITFRAFQNTGNTQVLNFFEVSMERSSGPSVIAASETVAMRATKNSGAHTSTGNTQTVASWNSVVQDTHGIFNATSGVAIIPVSGTYLINSIISFNANSTGSRASGIVRNTVQVNESNIYVSFSDRPRMLCFALIKCNAGDTINTQAFQSSGGNLNYDSFGISSFEIVRVGN